MAQVGAESGDPRYSGDPSWAFGPEPVTCLYNTGRGLGRPRAPRTVLGRSKWARNNSLGRGKND
jgi:hypothetical protein